MFLFSSLLENPNQAEGFRTERTKQKAALGE